MSQKQRSALEDADWQRIEESLRQSERKFRAIFDHTYQFMGLLAPDGTVIEANRTALEFCGVSGSGVLGKPLWECPWWTHSTEQQERVRSAVEDAARGNFVRLETTHATADGALHYVDFSLKPVFNDLGEVTLIIPEGRDVTERKKAETALCESSQMLKLVLEHMPAFVFWKDCNSVYLGCNSRFAANAGLNSPEEIVGLTDLDLPWKDSEAERYRADDRKVMDTGVPKLSYEETQFTADGRKTVLRTSKIPLKNPEGRVVGVLGAFEDISERKRAEQFLAETEAKYRCLVEESLVGVYLIQQGRFVYVNGRLAEIFGYSQEEVVGRAVEELVAPEDRTVVIDNVRKRETTEEKSIQYTFRGVRKDGRIIDVEVLGNGTVYDGKSAVLGSLLDITERKRAEEEQSRLRQHLQQAQKMEAVGQLAGGIAHDFNNILGIINGYSEILLRDPNVQDATRSSIEEILTAGQRAASLTRQLLAFSRKLVLKPKVLSLNAVIEGIDKMLRRLIGEEIEVRTTLARDLELVKADPSQMEQVLLNFCINARDAMPDGGRITIETANVEVDETLAAQHFSMSPGRYVRVAVSDTGTGMDSETLSHVFEPFFTTKGPEDGTGLGLATVYGIVKQSGGHVCASSEQGHGTTFFVFLPKAAAEGAAKQFDQGIRAGEVVRGSETILLVEDVAPLRALFRKVVEDNGYSVLEAEDGQQALQVSDEFQGEISLLLTDVSLPKMKGSVLARLLQTRRSGIKILFISGYTDTAIAPEELLQPGTAFLQKPFTAEALLLKVRELLDTAGEKTMPSRVVA
jgi:PAS domain S-box-containing protein